MKIVVVEYGKTGMDIGADLGHNEIDFAVL
jgi:hypothetical protein